MPCCPGATPVPKLDKAAAVVEGNAESTQTGTSPCPAWITDRRNGVWADFCFRRFRPSPSARTTHTREARGRPRVLEKPSTPRLAAALVSTSAMERCP
jgi:hypothetical protein